MFNFTINFLDFKKKKKKKILGYFNLFIFGALIFVTIKSSFEFYHQYFGNKAKLKQERVADKNFFIPKNVEVLSDRLLLPHIARAKVFPTLRAQAIIRDF